MQRVTSHAFPRFPHGIPRRRSVFLFLILLLVAFTAASNVDPELGNEIRLVNNWTITPAGKQTSLGDLPLNSVLSPDGRYLLVSNGGAGIQSLQVVTVANNKVIQTLPYYAPHSVFIGLAYSPDGKKVYASGGGEDVVHTFTVSDSGMLTADGDITIGTLQANPFPTGLSISPDGKTLYVANNLANNVSVVDTTTKTVVATIPIGGYPYPATNGSTSTAGQESDG